MLNRTQHQHGSLEDLDILVDVSHASNPLLPPDMHEQHRTRHEDRSLCGAQKTNVRSAADWTQRATTYHVLVTRASSAPEQDIEDLEGGARCGRAYDGRRE